MTIEINWNLRITPEQTAIAELMMARIDMNARIVAWIDTVTRHITGLVPEDERLSWPTKEIAARQFLMGVATEEQEVMISLESSLADEDPTSLAGKIVANANRYRRLISILTGLRHKAASELEITNSVAEVEEVFHNLKTQWAELLADMT